MDDEGFISEESDYNYQIKLPPTYQEGQETLTPLHSIPYKCVYLKHTQNSQFNQKYHFNGLLIQQYTWQQQQPTISNGMFDSQFECGNLYAAYEIKQNEFDLLLQDDTNTIGYSQWFYFAVENTLGMPLILNIVNLMKDYVQLKHDLSIHIYTNNKWKILNSPIRVKQSKYVKLKHPSSTRQLYQLSMKIPAKYVNYRLALNQPYTIGDLNHFLGYKYDVLTKSLSGLNVPILRFGSSDNDAIIIISRQHPGETVSSFVCQGLLESIQSDTVLTSQFHVIVLPLFNPDGVRWGNYRCDLSGRDLNRVWQRPNPDMHFQVVEAKRLLHQIISLRDIVCFVDLHGHSKKLNTFMYSCRGSQDAVQCRVLPHIFQQQSKYFDFKSCTFSLEPCKMKTARAFAYKLVKKSYPDKMHNIFTLETSFFGYSDAYSIKQFETKDLLQIGRDLVAALQIYYTNVKYRQSVLQELEKNRYIYQQQDLHNNDEASDSDPDSGLIIQKSNKIRKRFEKKGSIMKETGFFKKVQSPLQFTNNFVNARYFSLPKSKIESRTMKSHSLHQQLMNITSTQLKDYSVDVTPTNNMKLKTQQSSQHQEQEQGGGVTQSQKHSNFHFQKNVIVPPIHNGQSIKVVQKKPKQEQVKLSQSFQSSVCNNSPDNLVLMSRSIQKNWDPRLIFEFTQKVKRKNTQIKFQ